VNSLPVIAPLSLSNVATVAFAAICLWTIAAQARGNVVKLWRLAVPPCFAAVEAFMLLAGVFDATLVNDAEWLAAAVAGGVIGRVRGWTVAVEVDKRWELVRQHRSPDALVIGAALVMLAVIDFASAAYLDPVIAPQHVAAGAAFCAAYLGCRALAIAVRASRLPHVELHGF
jgi:membrane protein CcdC involved in cytochrome C biogenesis